MFNEIHKVINMEIIWIFFMLILCPIYDTQNFQTEVEQLSADIEKYFDDIRSFISASDLADKIQMEKKIVDKDISLKMLSESKIATEGIVNISANVVDRLEGGIKSMYNSFAVQPPVEYELECSNTSYVYYYRAKALQNGSQNIKDTCGIQSLILKKDPYIYNTLTNRDYSTVHIPTNVYYAAKELQNVANMTTSMDSVYNVAKDNSKIYWQYFCSNTGFFKIYPGVEWNIQVADSIKESTLVDFADCRSEQWYLESTAYPKKMMIIVDKSGSMKGRRKIIANHTISEILNTLTENDFFNIILVGKSFTKTFIFADNKTTDILVQATAKNKIFMMEELEKSFIPEGIAAYDDGIRESLKLLNKSKSDEKAENDRYNYLLMIISDGAPSNYQGVINESKHGLDLRIFTYLIGQGITEAEPVKQMACNNKGYAVEIATLADVKENVQKYLNVVARKNAIMKNIFNVWTGVHQNQVLTKTPTVSSITTLASVLAFPRMSLKLNDTQVLSSNSSIAMATGDNSTVIITNNKKIVLEQPEKIKMFVSTAKATYNTTGEGSLLGSVGIDVPISDFQNTAAIWKIGLNAYLFGVTNNGFLIFHPRFRPQYKTFIKYFYRNVDISEVEIPIGTKLDLIPDDQVLPSQLRESLLNINSTNGPQDLNLLINTFTIIDDFKTAFPTTRNYYITGIENTSYKFGLAIPINHTVPFYSGLSDCNSMSSNPLADITDTANKPSIEVGGNGITVAYFDFCKSSTVKAQLLLDNRLLLLKNAFGDCNYCGDNKLYVWSMFRELTDTIGYVDVWKKKVTKLGIQQIFTMHHHGVIRYYNYKKLSYENFILDHNNGINDPLYQDTILTAQALNDPTIMVIRPIANEEIKKDIPESNVVFTASQSLYTKEQYVGIAGVQLDYASLSDKFKQSALCNSSSVYECYLLTGSGLIVYSNIDYRQIGDHLKEIDCKLMKGLTDAKIYQSQTLFDFQGLCPNQPKLAESFANRLVDPFMAAWKLSIWLIYEAIIILQNISISSLFWSFTTAEENPDYSIVTPYQWRYCRQSYIRFLNVVNDTNVVQNGELNCKLNCNKPWFAKSIKNTSLILVVVKKLNCNCDCEGNFGQTQEIKRNLSSPLKNPTLQKPNYYTNFVEFTKSENSTICSDSASRIEILSHLQIILLSIIGIVIYL